MPRTPRNLLPFLTRTCAIATTLSGFALAGCQGDATTELPGGVPLACDQPQVRTLRVDGLAMPDGSLPLVGDDVDGDGTFDNNSGSVIQSVTQTYTDLQTTMPARVQRRLDGDTVLLIQIAQCDGDARVTLARGEVDGDRVRIVEPGRLPAAGLSDHVGLDAEGGVGVFPLGMVADLADTGQDGWIQVYPFALHLTATTGGMAGRISGGFAPWYDNLVANGFQTYLQRRLDADDTGWGMDVDADGNGTISRAELKADSLYATLMRPDLDVGGDVLDPPAVPALDGEAETLSFGFAIHAVDVVVE